MLGRNSTIRHKHQAAVEITLLGQEPFEGIVFLALGDRLIDLLNDDRSFIPIKKEDGPAIIVAKSQISSIVELYSDVPEEEIAIEDVVEETAEEEVAEENNDEAEADADAKARAAEERARRIRKFDPYATLRINPDATVEEIRAAYRTRIKAVHPDSIAALGLDDDLADAALKSTQKINFAYRKIMRDREDAAAAAEPAA